MIHARRHLHRGTTGVVLPAALSAALTLGLGPTAAGTGTGTDAAGTNARPSSTSLEVADGVRPIATGNDITRLKMYSASSQEPAALHVTFANMPLDYRVGTVVYLNLDRDARPDAAVAFGGQEWRIFKTNAWGGLGGRDLSNCGRVSEETTGVAIDLAPVCLGGRTNGRMAVSVEATLTRARAEYVPGRRKWSRKIRTYMREG